MAAASPLSRSRARLSSRTTGLAALGLLFLSYPGSARADVRFEVAGAAEVSADAIDVRVDLSNVGDTAAESLSVEGELLGSRAQARLARVSPATSRSVSLRFPASLSRPGVHALTLLLDYTPEGQGSLAVSQRAYLLLALGATSEPAVRLSVPGASMDWAGTLVVQLESADAAAHRVRLRVAVPRWLRVESPTGEIEVPAQGKAVAPVRLFRGTAPWGSRQGIVVVAEATDGDLARATVATGVVEIRPDPAWLPHLRRPLLLLAVILLTGALLVEWRQRFVRPAP